MKRVLSVLLVAAMLMAVLPMAAVSAADSVAKPAAMLYGDVNNDGNINNKDLGLLQQYLNEWDVNPDMVASDTNGDGKVNNKDLGLLQQYLNEWDVTLGPEDTRPTIKILSIGHSFSRDAMDTYMADLFKAAGYNATFGYLYYPGASLERQYHYVKDNNTSYQMYNKCVDGKWYYSNGSANADQAFMDEDWDIVTFQPSPDYGKGDVEYTCSFGCNRTITDYEHFDQLVKMVKDRLASFGNPDVKFYWHLTWAFASDCKLWSFAYSNYNQNTMFWDFLRATGKYVTPNPYVEDDFIPCITSIQNVRTSWMGDTFNEPGGSANADGYHLNDKGDLVAAMTWVAFFTGKSATEFKISTKYSDEQYAAFAEAVDNAIQKPLNITKSSYTTEP